MPRSPTVHLGWSMAVCPADLTVCLKIYYSLTQIPTSVFLTMDKTVPNKTEGSCEVKIVTACNSPQKSQNVILQNKFTKNKIKCGH